MRKISVSFLSSKDVVEDLFILNNTDVDYIHVDVMDGKFVKNKYMPYGTLNSTFTMLRKRFDVHLMVKNPIPFIEKYVNLNTEFITVHSELDEDIVNSSFKLIKSYKIKCGIAINPDTDIEVLKKYLDKVDLILVMSVFPGKGGQSFIDETTKRIDDIKKMIGNRKILISVDGGINKDTVMKARNTDIVVSGSFITNSDDFQENISILRK